LNWIIIWTSITSTDANKLERIQKKFSALCCNQVDYTYALALQQLKLHTLRKRKHRLDTLLFIQVYYLNSKFCSSVWKLLIFEPLLRIPENFPCAMTGLLVGIVFLLVGLQHLMLFVGTLTYLKPKIFILIMFYKLYLLIIHYKNSNCIEY
jgi:hypothetical protein